MAGLSWDRAAAFCRQFRTRSMRRNPYRWKSSLVIKGEVVTHQLDCAVAGSAASVLITLAFVAAVSVFFSSLALLPSVSQITRYFVKARIVERALGGGGAERNGWSAIQPGHARTSMARFENAASK